MGGELGDLVVGVSRLYERELGPEALEVFEGLGGPRAWEHAQPARLAFEEAFEPIVAEARWEGTLRPDFVSGDVGTLLPAVCATVEDAWPDRLQRFLAIAVDGLRTR